MAAWAKTILVFLILVLALTPSWIFLLIRYLAEPQGFWQNLALFGVGIWLLGVFQIVALLIGLIVVFIIITDS